MLLTRTARLQIAAGLAAAILFSGLVLQTSRAAFSFSTAETGSWDSGVVTLGENAATSVSFQNTSNMVPGDSDVACLTVSYSGDVAANVRLYASTTGTIGPYLDLTVQQVTIADSDASGSISTAECEAGSPVAGGSLVSSTTIDAFDAARSSFSDGLNTLAAGSAWSPGSMESKTYRIEVVLADDNDAQDRNGTATFTWEAQST